MAENSTDEGKRELNEPTMQDENELKLVPPVQSLSLDSIPSIDRSIPSIDRSEEDSLSEKTPDLAYTPSPEPNLAHTPPPEPAHVQSPPNLAHTPPPPPAPSSEGRCSSRPDSPRPPSLSGPPIGESPLEPYSITSPHSPSPRLPCPPLRKRASLDYPPEQGGYSGFGSSPPSISGSGYYGAVGGLYSSGASGVYSGSASLGSIYGCAPPPVPPPPLDGFRPPQHRREHSVNSVHSINSLRELYDKSNINQFISTSPKLSNRDIELNRFQSLYSTLSATTDYTGLTETFTDPVEEEGGERVVWEYHNVQLTRVPSYGFGIAVSGGRDNPHFRNGDPSVAISEVLKAGPAEGKLEVNDRLISANGISLENVDYSRAVQILRDSGQSVHLVVKRRIVLPHTPEPQTLKVTLHRNRKKEDYGLILGCRIFVKEVIPRSLADKDGTIKEGDILLRINSNSTDNISIKEAKKMMDGTKEKLQLLIRRENSTYSPHLSPDLSSKECRSPSFSLRPNYSSQNLYVQPPSRAEQARQEAEGKSNIRSPEPRFVSFRKEGSVGIRLTGGNETGIFVTAVQPKSQAQLQGLIAGDKILKVNEMDMTGITREEAVLYLMSLQDQIDLIVQTRLTDYHHVLNTQKGDLFYIRTHFHYEPDGKNELSFRSGDIFRVVDTLYNGVVGSWQVFRIGRNNQETQKGTIPNKARGEELATAQFNQAKKEQTQSESRGGFFKRRRNSRRSKSLGKDHWEDVVFADSVSKFPAYERVTLSPPGFTRPIVLFGPLADVAREKLCKEDKERFASPQLDSHCEKPSGIIRLSAIREILERGKHAVLDITPNAVDRLNYAQFYPIVIFLRAETKQMVKEMRSGRPKGRMSSKKLYDQSVKLEKLWSHVFTSTINLSQPDTWFKKVKETIDKQQNGPIWMSEAKPSESLTDDFLFPMTSRLSYASSPESDLETESRTPSKSPQRTITPGSGNGREGLSRDSRGRLVKSSSDPSIAANDDLGMGQGTNGTNLSTAGEVMQRMKDNPTDEKLNNTHGGISSDTKYGFATNNLQQSNIQMLSQNDYKPRDDTIAKGSVDPGGGGGGGLSPPQSSVLPHSMNHFGGNSRGGQPPPLSLPAAPSYSPQNPPPHFNLQGSRSPQSKPPPPHYSPTNGSNGCYQHHSMPHHISPPGLPANHGNIQVEISKPELPPKIDRLSKPGRHPQSPNQTHPDPMIKGKDFSDNNYINTTKGNSLERQNNKSAYDISTLPIGPNAHDDLKSRLHGGLVLGTNDPRYSRMPVSYAEDPYRYRSDYKPSPPPKGIHYKPVPPPKPKSYRGEPTPTSQWAGHDRKGGYAVGPNFHANGGLSDDYSGLDSGQGSSLDRKYDTVGRQPYAKVPQSARTGYYLNVPPPRERDGQQQQQLVHGGRDPNHRDLNHDHRGSAFELYKKPTDPRNQMLVGMGMNNNGSMGHVAPHYSSGPLMHPAGVASTQQMPYYEQGSR